MSEQATVKRELMSLDWWTPREVANRYRVSESTVTRWLNSGKLLGKKFGDQWRVCSAAVKAFESAGVPQPQPRRDTSAFDNVPDYTA